jgi:hypothetical protein
MKRSGFAGQAGWASTGAAASMQVVASSNRTVLIDGRPGEW